MTNDLTTLVHASADDVSPDVDRLLAVSVRVGMRMRHRRMLRYAGAGLGVGAVASVGAITLVLGGATTARHARPIGGPATAPASPTAPPPRRCRPARGSGSVAGGRHRGPLSTGTARPHQRHSHVHLALRLPGTGASTLPGAGTGFAVVLTGPSGAVSSFGSQGFRSPLLDDYDGLTYACPPTRRPSGASTTDRPSPSISQAGSRWAMSSMTSSR